MTSVQKLNGELLANTVILGIGKLFTQLLSFLLIPLYTTFLSTEEYGIYDLILSYVSLAVPILTLRLDTPLFRFLLDAREDNKKKSEIISNVMLLVAPISLVASGVLIAIGILTSSLLFPLIGALFLTNVGLAVNQQLLRGLGHNKSFTISSIIVGATTLIGVLTLIVVLGCGVNGILIATVVANVLGIFYAACASNSMRFVKLSSRDRSVQKKLVKYSAPMVADSISWWVTSISDRSIISIFLGVSANGIYAIANKFGYILNGVASIYMASWTESASLHIASKERDKFFSVASTNYIKIFFSLSLLIISIMPLAFHFVVGADFAEAYLYIPIFIAAAIANAFLGLYYAIYIALKKTREIAATTILSAIINIAINVALINIIGLWAAAISTLVAYLVMAIYRHYDMKKYVKIRYERFLFVKLFAVFAVVFALYYLNNPVLNLANVVFAVVVAAAMNWQIIRGLPRLARSFLKRN